MSNSSKSEKDRLSLIQKFASEFSLQEETVSAIYEEELNKLKKTAKVRRYIPLLVTRKIREILSAHS